MTNPPNRPVQSVPTTRILVVEDNPINQKLIVRLLTSLGFDTDVAGNGSEALPLLSANNAYAAILMDLQMPIMDGLTTARTIRTLPGNISRIPIIAVTANAFDGTRQSCIAAGMNDFLTKPIERDKFVAALQRWTGICIDKAKLTA